MRSIGAIVGSFALILIIGLAFVEAPAHAQGKGQSAIKGLEQAIQKVSPQAEQKLIQAIQKGNYKGQSYQKGKGKGKR
jgi:hypothetical protein